MGSRANVPAAVTVAVLAALGVSTQANANVILDQANPADSLSFGSGVAWQQEIVAGMDGTLDSIDVYLSGLGTIDIAIFANAEPWQLGTPDFAGTITVNGAGAYDVDLSAAGIPVFAGESFVLELGASDFVAPSGTQNPGNDYVGELWMDHPVYGQTTYESLGGIGYDLGFQTYVNTPAPGALAMLGLAGIGGVRRRRR